jgi:ketosteroid isomerase-like protein
MDSTDAHGPTEVIAEARKRFIAALRRGDAPAAAAAYTDDARLLAPSAELLAGRSSIARFWQAGIDAGVDSIELHALDVEIEPGGDTALEIGRYVLRLTSPSGDGVVDRGRYLLVYRREADGAWRRAAETFNPDDARAPQTREPMARAEVLEASGDA